MAKPLFLIVDDDPTSLNTLQQDLKQHYGDDYEIRCADSSDEAARLLNHEKPRGDNFSNGFPENLRNRR